VTETPRATDAAALSLGARIVSCEPSLVKSTTSAPSSREAWVPGLGLPLRTLSDTSSVSSGASSTYACCVAWATPGVRIVAGAADSLASSS
jgi:hypothetical protein